MTPPANPSDNYNKTFFTSLTSKLCCFPLQAFPVYLRVRLEPTSAEKACQEQHASLFARAKKNVLLH